MASDKKLVAAAAHLRGQADVLADRVKRQRGKVERMRDLLAAAEEGLENTERDAEEAEQAAQEAAEVARGLDVSVYPEAANVGMER